MQLPFYASSCRDCRRNVTIFRHHLSSYFLFKLSRYDKKRREPAAKWTDVVNRGTWNL